MPSFRSLSDESQDLTDSPIIGVCAWPWAAAKRNAKGKIIGYEQGAYNPFRQFIATSYIKFIESAGARAAPINFHSTRDEIELLFSQINGILLPGGDGAYPDQIKMILDVAMKINQNGRYFPIFGTCLGFQYISQHFAVNYGKWAPDESKEQYTAFEFLDDTPVRNQSNPLTFTEDAKNSQWYIDMPDYLRVAAEKEPLTANFHSYGVTLDNFNKHLKDQFILVATAVANVDVPIAEREETEKKLQEGDELIPHPTDSDKLIWKKPHVTHMEHRKYPIFAVQYHPERTIFEWGVEGTGELAQKISRSRNAILLSQYTSTFFVFACRKSPNKFKCLIDQHTKLIYQYPKTFFGAGIVEMYLFDHWPPQAKNAKNGQIIIETEDGSIPLQPLRYINGERVGDKDIVSPSVEPDEAEAQIIVIPKQDDHQGASLVAPM